MKWWTVPGALGGVSLALGAIAYAVGSMLPAEHVAERSADVAADAARVAERIRAVEAQPQWRRKVTRVEVHERGPHQVRYTEFAGRDAIAFDMTADREGRRFVSTIASADLPFGGRWLIALEPIAASRTRVTIREEGVVRPPVFRALSRYVIGHGATMDAYLEDLSNSFEER